MWTVLSLFSAGSYNCIHKNWSLVHYQCASLPKVPLYNSSLVWACCLVLRDGLCVWIHKSPLLWKREISFCWIHYAFRITSAGNNYISGNILLKSLARKSFLPTRIKSFYNCSVCGTVVTEQCIKSLMARCRDLTVCRPVLTLVSHAFHPLAGPDKGV